MSKGLIFTAYILSLFLLAVLPLNGSTGKRLDTTFILSFRLDHWLHSLLFVPFVFIGLASFRPKGLPGKLLLVAAGIVTAVVTEGIQYFLPYRGFSIADMSSNLLGVLAGAGVLIVIRDA